MTDQYFGGQRPKVMTNSQLRKIKQNMQKSYNKIPIISNIEKQVEGEKELLADEILEKQLNDLDE